MIKSSRTDRSYPLLFRPTSFGRTMRLGCLLVIFICLTLLCGCFTHTGSISGKISTGTNSVNNIYEQSFAVEDSDTLNDELIASLVVYLQEYHMEVDIPDSSLSIKIDRIKNGQQPLLVDFDPTNFYFVCGYYNGITEDGPLQYNNADEYTWVRFESQDEIKEIHEDKKFVVAFQINKALLVKDIASEKAIIPRVEHFQMYDPFFENGVNTNTHVVFEREFIYINSSNADRIYHSVTAHNHQVVTIPCILLDNKYYITRVTHTIYASGNKAEGNLKEDFGTYYDALISIMDTTRYNVTNEQGRTDYYGLIEINDFVIHIIK